MTVRIAMWSAPCRLANALMRAWGSRADTFVTDEPLYAHFLQRSGLQTPDRDATLAAHETDWREVTEWLIDDVPGDKPVWYQKHMAHHLTGDVGRDWIDDVTHAFLIREPSEMLVSLAAVIPHPTIDDTGLPQQLSIFERVRGDLGIDPPVIDGDDLLRDPRAGLNALCTALGQPFDPAMLAWKPGLHATDGAWAPFRYGDIADTSGFGSLRTQRVDLPDALHGLHAECVALYERMAGARLRF